VYIRVNKSYSLIKRESSGDQNSIKINRIKSDIELRDVSDYTRFYVSGMQPQVFLLTKGL
jgi:hypothetical protein